MVTEKEAKLRWCPHVRAANDQNYPAENRTCAEGKVLRTTPPLDWDRCIASECMMWRWESTINYMSSEGKGFCGLAGICKMK